MSWFERAVTRCTRWIGELANGAIGVFTSVAHRVGYPSILAVPVSAAILSRVPVVQGGQSLEEVASLFIGTRHEVLPVLDHGKPVAAITRGDVAAGLERVGPRGPVAAVASHQIITVTPTDSLADVLERLRAMPEAVAVVVDHGGPVGLVTAERLIAYLDAGSTV